MLYFPVILICKHYLLHNNQAFVESKITAVEKSATDVQCFETGSKLNFTTFKIKESLLKSLLLTSQSLVFMKHPRPTTSLLNLLLLFFPNGLKRKTPIELDCPQYSESSSESPQSRRHCKGSSKEKVLNDQYHTTRQKDLR